MKKIFLILMFAITGSFGSTFAQVVLSDKTGWHKIGSKTLDVASTKEEMSVIGSNRFATLRFKAKDAPVTIEGVDIYFTDGSTQHINLHETLKPVAEKNKSLMKTDKEVNAEMETTSAGMSKEIMLTDAERSIVKIAFTYKAGMMKKGSEKPFVEIWGLKTNWEKDKINP